MAAPDGLAVRRRSLLGMGSLGLLLGIAGYVAGTEWVGGSPACPTHGVVDCAAVLAGPGSHPLGVPLAAWGMLWAAVGLWAMGAGARLRLGWMAAGGLGLLWAWVHEWDDLHLCLWCSAIQLLAIGALAAAPEWRAWEAGLRRVLAVWRSGPGPRRQAGLSALLALAAFWLAVAMRHWHVPDAILWGGFWAMVAGMGALLWMAWRQASAARRLFWAVPGGVGAAAAAGGAACAGVCAPGGAWLLGLLGVGAGLVAQVLLGLAVAWGLVVGVMLIGLRGGGRPT